MPEILSKEDKKKKIKTKVSQGNDAQSSHSSTIAAALTELNMCTTDLKQNLWEARTYVFNDILQTFTRNDSSIP